MDQVKDKRNTDELWAENMTIRQAMKKLNSKEKDIINRRFFGIKPQLEAVIIEEDFYGLYDADGYAKEENKIIKSLSEEFNFKPLIIKSSNEGEHWLYKGSELRTLSNSVNNSYIRNKIFIEHAWACLYNPFN